MKGLKKPSSQALNFATKYKIIILLYFKRIEDRSPYITNFKKSIFNDNVIIIHGA